MWYLLSRRMALLPQLLFMSGEYFCLDPSLSLVKEISNCRFGKLGVVWSGSKCVDIEINGKEVAKIKYMIFSKIFSSLIPNFISTFKILIHLRWTCPWFWMTGEWLSSVKKMTMAKLMKQMRRTTTALNKANEMKLDWTNVTGRKCKGQGIFGTENTFEFYSSLKVDEQ